MPGYEQEDELFLARLEDMQSQTLKRKTPQFSAFCDPHQLGLVRHLSLSPFVTVRTWGGHADCERAMVGIFPDFQEPDEALFPISAICVKGTGGAGHRELLGSLMGLGIKRETIGDIFSLPQQAFIFATQTMADYICMNLDRVGREHVTAEAVMPADVCLPERAFRLMEGTLASLRLDCVVAFVMGVSRAKASAYIAGDLVSINWEPCGNSSAQVKEGDLLSIRRFGRVALASVAGETKKGRIRVMMKRYL